MKTLNRTQLKFIAICAMVCDHVAWGFLDFMTPLAQVMHVIGRLTIPIMCFFVAEGFRHTSGRREYCRRMALFWIVTIVPFYLFFGEMYEYRQNIIFDLLLGLLLLMVLENKRFRLWQKILLGAGLFGVSATVGGWVIMPMLYILVFYYVRDFKKQAAWICGLTVALVLFLAVAIWLNKILHFSHYDWIWYEKLYFLGFMLPLLLLKRYNGQKGKNIIGKYFFYIFYPAHFLVLAGIRAVVAGVTAYQLYVAVHVIALLVCLGILLIVLFARPSRGQIGTLLLVLAGCIYTFGFTVEITSGNVNGFYAATLIQYFGECLLMIAFTFFISEMCHRAVPAYIYALEILAGSFIMWMLFTTRENQIFYTSIGIDETGPFPRLVLTYGWGFGAFVAYLAIVCVSCIVVCILGMRESHGGERKRIMCTASAIVCPWIPILLRDAGLTGGYEVPCLGVVAAAILVGMALIKYGYFDSIALAGENALNHGKEGIMVINTRRVIIYFNKKVEEMFGNLSLKQNVYENKMLADIFEGKIKTLEIEGRMYEMRVEPLVEGGYEQGHMLWALDITEHHEKLVKVSDLASKDALTGIYNRSHFRGVLEAWLEQKVDGSLVMMDLDNFTQVNDRFGHQIGDEVLTRFSQILIELGDAVLPCRIGGGEFCLFYKGVTGTKELEKLAQKISSEFYKKLEGEKYAGVTTLFIGIARTLEAEDREFETLFSNADKALYVAKNRSKNAFYIL